MRYGTYRHNNVDVALTEGDARSYTSYPPVKWADVKVLFGDTSCQGFQQQVGNAVAPLLKAVFAAVIHSRRMSVQNHGRRILRAA